MSGDRKGNGSGGRGAPEDSLPPDLPRLLTAVLLSIEGIRRDPHAGDRDWREAREALDAFDSKQAEGVPLPIAGDVHAAVEDARSALEARDTETARSSLIRVGQAFDGWLKRRS